MKKAANDGCANSCCNKLFACVNMRPHKQLPRYDRYYGEQDCRNNVIPLKKQN